MTPPTDPLAPRAVPVPVDVLTQIEAALRPFVRSVSSFIQHEATYEEAVRVEEAIAALRSAREQATEAKPGEPVAHVTPTVFAKLALEKLGYGPSYMPRCPCCCADLAPGIPHTCTDRPAPTPAPARGEAPRERALLRDVQTALRLAEFVQRSDKAPQSYCPECDREEDEGHEEGCRIARGVRAAEALLVPPAETVREEGPDREEVARALHDAWCARMRAKGKHGHGEPCEGFVFDPFTRKRHVCGEDDAVGFGPWRCDHWLLSLVPWSDVDPAVREELLADADAVLALLSRKASPGDAAGDTRGRQA